VVEGFNVVWGALGVCIAVVFIGVAYQYPLADLPGLRTALGLFCGAVGLVSLPAAWALKDARQPADAARISFLASIKDVSSNRPFRWLVLANALDGVAGTIRERPSAFVPTHKQTKANCLLVWQGLPSTCTTTRSWRG